MSDDPSPLDPRTLALLREERVPPGDARVRARARLAVALAATSAGAGGGGTSSPAGGGARAAGGLLGGHGAVVLAFVVGGAAGAGLHAALTSAPPAQFVYVDRAAPAPPSSAIRPDPTASPSASAAPAVTGAPDAPVSARAPNAVSRTSQLSAERSLLDEARTSIAVGDPNAALGRLRVSREEFPHPILGEEREALTIEALVGAHRYDEARARADAFRQRSPDSLFSAAVEGAIHSIP